MDGLIVPLKYYLLICIFLNDMLLHYCSLILLVSTHFSVMLIVICLFYFHFITQDIAPQAVT